MKFLTQKEVEVILRRKGITLQLWRSKGFGPEWLRIRGRVLYPADKLAEWLRSQANQSKQAPTHATEVSENA
jgi:hypothetical protein